MSPPYNLDLVDTMFDSNLLDANNDFETVGIFKVDGFDEPEGILTRLGSGTTSKGPSDEDKHVFGVGISIISCVDVHRLLDTSFKLVEWTDPSFLHKLVGFGVGQFELDPSV